MYAPKDHTFVLCAYKKSPFLEDCLISLQEQVIQSNVLVATSTPNDYIKECCEKFRVPLFVNAGGSGISSDWNFALSCASTSLVTIAHQDDTYEPCYTQHMLGAVNSVKKPLLFFTNYGELRHGACVDKNSLLNIKRKMLAPLKLPFLRGSRFVRRRILSFGSAICCPSVTMVVPNLFIPLFKSTFSCNLDWDAWERVSRLEGAFYYDPAILMRHRIHLGSETTALIENNTRTKEDIAMLSRFWPRQIVKFISRFYLTSQKSNE